MSSDLMDNRDGEEWDYLCPQFCDFTTTETTEQLQRIDQFFAVDHEINVQKTEKQVFNDLNSMNNSVKEVVNEVVKEANEVLRYETPPQNKENFDDDNDVYYSTKKSFTVEKKRSFGLRLTPMRTLQINGLTPFRGMQTSSQKKKKKRQTNRSQLAEEETLVFNLDPLLESLPIESNSCKTSDEEPNECQTQIQSEEVNDIEDEVFINGVNENQLQTEAMADMPVTGRESYVIEKKVQKTVQVISPQKSAKSSVKKRFGNLVRRKGTPIRKSTSGAVRVTTNSIVSRLYSTVKRKNTFKSMAELLIEFESKTRSCDRFPIEDPLNARIASAQRSRSSSLSSLTRPQSPKLHAINRHRPTPRQTEDIIASQIKKYSFKANPIRKKLFDSKFASGIPRVKSIKEPTKALEMYFLTDKRLEKRTAKNSTDETDAQNRQMAFKANPMPVFKSKPLLLSKSAKKMTSFKPFSFDERIQQLVAKKRNTCEETQNKDFTRKTFKF